MAELLGSIGWQLLEFGGFHGYESKFKLLKSLTSQHHGKEIRHQDHKVRRSVHEGLIVGEPVWVAKIGVEKGRLLIQDTSEAVSRVKHRNVDFIDGRIDISELECETVLAFRIRVDIAKEILDLTKCVQVQSSLLCKT